MSYRTDWMDCQSEVRCIDVLMKAYFGDHHEDVSSALQLLNEQLVDARRILQVAEQNAIIDKAVITRNEALAEIQRITKGDGK